MPGGVDRLDLPDFLASLPAVALLAVGTLLLVIEAALLIGVVLPGGSVVVALGALVGVGELPWWLVIAVAATASVAGGALGYQRSRAHAARLTPSWWHRPRLTRLRESWPARRITAVAGAVHPVVIARVHRAPRGVAAGGQCLAVLRTLTPRVSADAGVPIRRWLTGAIPAALVWATGMSAAGFLAGSLLAKLPIIFGAAGAATVTGIIAVRVLLARRRSRAAGQPAIRSSTAEANGASAASV